MQPIFDVHPLVLLAVVVGITAVFLAIGHVALTVLHRTYRGDAQRLPVAPFFVAVTTPWALILGFLSADIWSAMHDAGEAVRNERAGLLRLESLAAPDVLALPALLDGVRAYSDAVQKIEWGELRNRAASPEVDATVRRMWAAIAHAGRDGVHGPLASELMRGLDLVQEARAKRLAIGSHHVDGYKWLLLALLSLLAFIATAAVHRDRPPAGRLAMLIFAGTMAACIWVLALHASPYVGPAGLDAARLSLHKPAA